MQTNLFDSEIKPLWNIVPRIAGPAFTITLSVGDNLMFYAAIYEAPPGNKHAILDIFFGEAINSSIIWEACEPLSIGYFNCNE